jgi:hypothetical protein
MLGAKPPSSPTAVASKPNLSLITFFKWWYTSEPIFMASVKVPAPMSQNRHLDLVDMFASTELQKFLFSFSFRNSFKNIKDRHDLSVSVTADT